MSSNMKPGRVSVALLILALVGLAGCSDRGTDSDHDDLDPVTAQVYERGTETLVAEYHDGGWEGGLALAVGEETAVDVRFLDVDGDQIPLGGEYTLEAEIPSGEPTDVISVEPHGDHLDVEGLVPGETSLRLHLWHGNHADWSTLPLSVTVTE